jgi:energy-coupling factor transporter ATP-binding protein EcfA2
MRTESWTADGEPVPPEERGSLAERFEALGAFVRVAWAHVAADSDLSDVDISSLAGAAELSERAGARLRLSGEHTVVALAGATGGGKSSLFNALGRIQLSVTGHLRPTTGSAHACVWGEHGADQLLDWLGVSHRFHRESLLDAEDEAALRGLVLLDLPDLDSVATGHRLETDRLVGVVDLVIWVLDPQKYADQTVHEEYLSRMGALREVTVVVFNQTDLLTPADERRCLADLARLVEADGLAGVPVLGTSARTGAGVADLRTLLEKAIAGRHAAFSRLEGELDQAVDQLIPLVRTQRTAPDEVLDAKTRAELAEEFGTAASVQAVAAAAGRGYARRASVPGWPFQRRSAGQRGSSRVPPADPALVAAAVRRAAAVAGAGLPAPWQDQVQRAISGGAGRIPDELGEALTHAAPPPPRRIGWLLARVLFWLGLASLVAGGAWLAWHTWGGGPAPPRVAGPSLPLLLASAGLLVALSVPLVARPWARARGRRYAARVQASLRDATATVAEQSIAPAREVLHDYVAARAALQAAASRRTRPA